MPKKQLGFAVALLAAVSLLAVVPSHRGPDESASGSGPPTVGRDSRTTSSGEQRMSDEPSEHKHTNRLIHETSPYLLQHAHNPVDWHPWGPEALEQARQQDKPIFLSIGYSTCHWCHVMERESFEDETVAALLNEHFIAIKVDREERPDVDETYMKAVQMMTGSGGWPLSVFLTPDGTPFYGGTYFPPESMYGRPGFRQVLVAVAEGWAGRRQDLLDAAQRIREGLNLSAASDAAGLPAPEILGNASAVLAVQFDAAHGGFGEAPKFPQPSTLMLLLNAWCRTGDEKVLAMVTQTLDAMARGGIHDHLGGGFHRYATDARWRVPHFEKMLYDQALLAQVYVQAYQVTERQAYATVARDVFDYVLRDMTDAAGGFYAAEDADSEGREGTFYVWEPDEIQAVLGVESAAAFCAYYGVTREGNFEDGKTILHVPGSTERPGAELGAVPRDIRAAAGQLLERRNGRPRPHRDDKIITAWNGLMISALAPGGAVLDEPRYVKAAEDAAEFVLARLRLDGRLRRYFRAGRAVEMGFLDDYAFLILGLIDLYEASFEARWLREAEGLADQMIDLFADEAGGGFYLAGRDVERLITRAKPSYDGAVPSGNSIAALALLKLGRLGDKARFSSAGQRVLQTFSGPMSQSPTALTAMARALDYAVGPTQEIVIAGSQSQAEAAALMGEVRRHFLPNAVLIFRPWGPEGTAIEDIAAFTANLGPIQGRAAAYVCENYACRQPVTSPEALRDILSGISRKK